MCEFEKKVYENLKSCGLSFEEGADGSRLPSPGAAVSGGADSISLLVSLLKILTEFKAGGKAAPEKLFVITVNHNIRPAEESGGDAQYVKELCQKLEKETGIKIVCQIVELERGAVEAEAQQRNRGTEDAARSLRYAAFEKFICQNQLDSLCLAHNRNDQLETILMRFLQGASFDSAGGIRMRRGPYVRPLLNIPRTEIEAYLTGLGIAWRTDKTNYETDYLRNKIRLKLLPFLDENFEGWQTAALKGAEKNAEDSDLIQSWLQGFPIYEEEAGVLRLSLKDFLPAPEALKYRILREACIRAEETERIPYNFLRDVITCQTASFSKRFGTIEIKKDKENLFIKKYSESNTDLIFSDIIEESGIFEFPFGNLNVYNYREQDGKFYVDVKAGCSLAENIPLPFCVRSSRAGDTVLAADASEKKVSDIFSDWHLSPEKRSLVPVIQLLDERNQRIKAILGGFLGYKDWIVKL
jgi:tRNA(Ile)-lysidine synthase